MSHTRRARAWAPLAFLLAAAACAQATSPGEGGDGDGDTTLPSNSGGSIISGSSGGALTGAGGLGASSGGMGGDANTGGAGTGTGGVTFEGNCASLPPYGEVSATGDFGVHYCVEDRDGCKGVALNEYHVFQCVSTHFPNCQQNPGQNSGSWDYVAPCASWGMGGGAGSSGM